MLVLVAAAGAALLLPTAAAAKKKHRKVTKLGPVVTVTATGPPATGTGAVSSAAASCPSGTRVIGGGFSLQGSPQVVAVFESYRSAPGVWTASLIAANSSSTGVPTSIAYCRRVNRPITDVTASTTIAGMLVSKSLSASCPRGSRLVGGGFQSTHLPASRSIALPMSNMSTGPSTWSLTGLSNSPSSLTMTVHAYCLAGIRAPTVVSAQNTPILAGGKQATVTTSSCPVTRKKKGKRKAPQQLLSAGGFSTPVRTTGQIGLFISSLAGPSGWASSIFNATSTAGPLSTTSQGICV